MQTIVANDTCQKLQSLYYYETARGRGDLAINGGISGAAIIPAIGITSDIAGVSPSERSALLGRIYHTNCAALLGDDACVQVEFV